jgi:hypothetical protein
VSCTCTAAEIPFDDVLTQLGAANVQEAIAVLAELVAGLSTGLFWLADFTSSENSALTGIL